MSGRYHWRDGIYFERRDDLEEGSVEITLTKLPSNSTLSLLIPASEWQSIIAHVSKDGGTAESYAKAEALHKG